MCFCLSWSSNGFTFRSGVLKLMKVCLMLLSQAVGNVHPSSEVGFCEFVESNALMSETFRIMEDGRFVLAYFFGKSYSGELKILSLYLIIF